ncbi:hypothetical protein HDZ31DRAFT_82267 [Schizophyllum fasciatum]
MAGIRYLLCQTVRYMDGLIQVAIFVLTLVAVVGAYDSNPIYVTACGALAALGALWAFWRQVRARRAIMARHDMQALDGLPLHTSSPSWKPHAPTLSTPTPGTWSLPRARGRSPTSDSPPPSSIKKGLETQRLNYITQLTGTPFEFRDTSHGPAHQPVWTSQLFFGGKLVGESHNQSKKAAHDGAAAVALRKFDEEEHTRSSSMDDEKASSGEDSYLVDVGGDERVARANSARAFF